jgi:hypothetical protein
MTILAVFQNDRVYVGNYNLLNAVYPLPCLSPTAIGRLTGAAKELFGPCRELMFQTRLIRQRASVGDVFMSRMCPISGPGTRSR